MALAKMTSLAEFNAMRKQVSKDKPNNVKDTYYLSFIAFDDNVNLF
jgi:hypothetical protein